MSPVDVATIIGFIAISVAGIVFSRRVRAILYAMIGYPFRRVTIVFRDDGTYTIEREYPSRAG